jgi:hypothetical protein
MTYLDPADLAYEVISGDASGLHIFLAPVTSLKSFDGVAAAPVYAEALPWRTPKPRRTRSSAAST